MKHKPGVIFIVIILLLASPVFVFSQTKDTITDSHYVWAELQKKFIAYYKDSSANKLTSYQRQTAINFIQTKLFLVNVTYLGYDYRIHTGQIICHRTIADEVAGIFIELLQMKFPVHQCKPVSEFGFSDLLSMQANNTNGFDYRLKTGSRTTSKHSYGFAIDINPVENPYQKGNEILPVNRNETINTGRIRTTEEEGRKVIAIFRKHGWVWGGNWRSLKDYMHFEKQ